MSDIPNTSIIEEYLQSLQECSDDTQRELDKCQATVDKAQADYNVKKAYYDKLKVYWDKLETTNKCSKDSLDQLTRTESAADGLKSIIVLDVEAIECLVDKVAAFSETLEAYKLWVTLLEEKIGDITKSALEKDGAIPKALICLKDAYSEAIIAATAALTETLCLLEKAYIMQYKLIGKNRSDLNAVCPDRGTGVPDQSDSHQLCYEGLSQRIKMMKANFRTDASTSWLDAHFFPVYLGCGTYDFNLKHWQYAADTKSELDSAEVAMDAASTTLSTAIGKKDGLLAQKNSIDRSLEAATSAKAC